MSSSFSHSPEETESASTRKASLERGQAYLSEGRLGEAESVYRTLLRADLNDIEAFFGLGRVARRQGNTRIAEMALLKVLDNEPRHVGALVEIGEIFLVQGRPDEALEAYVNGADISFEQGQLEEAAALYARILQFEPNDRLAAERLAALGHPSR